MAKKKKKPLELYLDEILTPEEIEFIERLAAERGTDVAEVTGTAMVAYLRSIGLGDDTMSFPPFGTKKPVFLVDDDPADDAGDE
jgi:hypothetical protein